MSGLKEIRTRIASVKSTRQITSAMKMVAAARLRKAQDAIIQLRPYADKLQEVLSNLSSSTEVSENNVYSHQREINKVLIIAVTSNKGLCGAFNSNVVKSTINLIQTKYSNLYQEGNVDIFTIGKKGHDFLKSKNYKIINSNTEIFNNLNFENVAPIAESVMQSFATGEYDIIELVYNQFKNAAVQILTQEQFLPIVPSANEEDASASFDYILEPSKEYIIEKLIPKSLRIQFYKCLLDSNTSEYGARMTSMHQATDNATELIKDLTLTYNKARQASITREIIEIVSGAEALKE